MGAECDDVAGAGAAGLDAGGVVVGVGVGLRAGGLEQPRVRGRLALLRAAVAARAAVLRRPERRARALARHHPVVGAAAHREPRGAHLVEVADAPRRRAPAPRPPERRHRHRDVVAVDEAHVVKVLPPPSMQKLTTDYSKNLSRQFHI